MKTIKYFSLLAVSALLLSSCQENRTPLSTDDINLADDEAVTEALFDDVFSSADNAVQLLDSYTKSVDAKDDGVVVLTDSCPLVTVDM